MPLTEDTHGANTDAPYCKFCTTETGALQPFEERFERMTQWAIRKDGLEPEAAKQKTREYMRSMPAWRDHPALKAAG
jgi:hypothetical protein